jgi:hypothetical protein
MEVHYLHIGSIIESELTCGWIQLSFVNHQMLLRLKEKDRTYPSFLMYKGGRTHYNKIQFLGFSIVDDAHPFEMESKSP